ncbi:MAG: hypothetical protein WCI74_20975, partial [Actinomycetes bacterium]
MAKAPAKKAPAKRTAAKKTAESATTDGVESKPPAKTAGVRKSTAKSAPVKKDVAAQEEAPVEVDVEVSTLDELAVLDVEAHGTTAAADDLKNAVVGDCSVDDMWDLVVQAHLNSVQEGACTRVDLEAPGRLP